MLSDHQPLAGIRILVTRAEGQAETFSDLLLPLGAAVTEIPVLEIRAPESFEDLDRALNSLPKYDWVIFASKNAVNYTLARAQTLGINLAGQSGPKFAAVGAATGECLKKNGLALDFCPSSFVAEFMIEEFPGYPELQGLNVFWPRTNIGRNLIADKLKECGAIVDTAVAYLTDLPVQPLALASRLVSMLEKDEIDVITLASAQSARNLAKLIKLGCSGEPGGSEKTLKILLSSVKIAVIGPITAETARQELGKVDIEAEEFTLPGLTKALLASLKYGQKE